MRHRCKESLDGASKSFEISGAVHSDTGWTWFSIVCSESRAELHPKSAKPRHPHTTQSMAILVPRLKRDFQSD